MSTGRGRLGPVLLGWTDAPAFDRFGVGRRLLAELVTELTGDADVEIFRACPRCGGHDHGMPRVRAHPVAVSVSYAQELVAVAAVRTADAASVGVDVEPVASAARVGELAPLFAPRSAPDLRGWTLLEAAVKADGRGFDIDPAAVAFGPTVTSMLGDAVMIDLPGREEPMIAAATAGPEGFVLSVAVRGVVAPGGAVLSAGAPSRGARAFRGAPEVAVRPATPRTAH